MASSRQSDVCWGNLKTSLPIFCYSECYHKMLVTWMVQCDIIMFKLGDSDQFTLDTIKYFITCIKKCLDFDITHKEQYNWIKIGKHYHYCNALNLNNNI